MVKTIGPRTFRNHFYLFSFFILTFFTLCWGRAASAFDLRSWKQRVISPSCNQLKNDFTKMKSQIEHANIGGKSIQDLQKKYNEKMGLKLAYQGARQLKEDYLQNMMSYHSSMEPAEKLDTLGDALYSLGALKAFSGLLNDINFEEAGTAKKFNLVETLKQNPTEEEFIQELEDVCGKASAPLSPFCQKLSEVDPDKKTENLARGFFKLARMGDIDQKTIADFNLNISLTNIPGMDQNQKDPQAETIRQLQDSIQALQKCRTAKAGRVCRTHEERVKLLEDQLTGYQNKLETEFEKHEVHNFTTTLKDLFTYNKVDIKTDTFYKKLEAIRAINQKKSLRDLDVEMATLLEDYCGSTRNFDIQKGDCKGKSILTMPGTQRLKAINQERAAIKAKLQEEKYHGHWKTVLEGTKEARGKYEDWVKKTYPDGESRDGLNLFIHSTNAACADLFFDPEKGGLADCLNSFPNQELADKAEAAFNTYRTQMQTDPTLKPIMDKVNSPLGEVSRDFLSLLRKNWKLHKNDPSFPICNELLPPQFPEDQKITKENFSMDAVTDCLEVLDSISLAAKEKDLERELLEITDDLVKMGKNKKMKPYLDQMHFLMAGITQEGCPTDEIFEDLKDSLQGDCSAQASHGVLPFEPFLQTLSGEMDKIKRNLHKGKQTIKQEKWIVGMMNAGNKIPDEPKPSVIEKYEDRVYQDSVVNSIVQDQSKLSPMYPLMGMLSATPYVMNTWMGVASTNSMIPMMYNQGAGMIYYQHNLRMQSYMFQGYSMWGGYGYGF